VKAAERIRAELGLNMAESMAAAGQGGESPPAGPLPPDRYAGTKAIRGALLVPLDRVVPDPAQPRRDFDQDAIERLAGSLRDRGQVQPCRVRWDEPQGAYVLISGERRWRAAKLAGLPALQCVEVRGDLTDDQVLDEQLTENCLREDLSPVEQATAFRALMGKRGWSQTQLARHLHLSQPTVSRALALLDLPGEVVEAVRSGAVSPNRARLGQAPPPPRVTAEPYRVEARGSVVTVKSDRTLSDPEALLVLQEAARVVRARVRSAVDAA
jgi:ParB family transcriptional regulator, chromosome partitioning protein